VEIIWTTSGEYGVAEIADDRGRNDWPKYFGKDIEINFVGRNNQWAKIMYVDQDSVEHVCQWPTWL
jgi:hypothetical protein